MRNNAKKHSVFIVMILFLLNVNITMCTLWPLLQVGRTLISVNERKPPHHTSLQSFYSILPFRSSFQNGTGDLNGNPISISCINNSLLERLFRCISCLSLLLPSDQSGETLMDGLPTQYHPSLFPLSIRYEGLETRDGWWFSHHFREMKVTPTEGPFLIYRIFASMHQWGNFLSSVWSNT